MCLAAKSSLVHCPSPYLSFKSSYFDTETTNESSSTFRLGGPGRYLGRQLGQALMELRFFVVHIGLRVEHPVRLYENDALRLVDLEP